MKTKSTFPAALAALALTFAIAGCGRDTRVNSNPGPGGSSAADSGKPVPGAAENSKGASSGSASTSASTGTDSTGRPSDASGGTTGADAAKQSSGANGQPAPAKQP